MDRSIRHVLASVATAIVAACAPINETTLVELPPVDPAVALANAKVGDGDPYREGYIGTGQNSIHYVEAGEGPTMIFVHGFPAFWYIWFDQMEALRQCRRVIAIDALGANLSSKPTDPEHYQIEALANGLDIVIAQLSPNEKVTLVGHDWGGALAWSYAERDDSRIERLVVYSAPPQDLLIELLAKNEEQRIMSGYMDRFHSITLDQIKQQSMHHGLFELAYREMINRGVLDEDEGQAIQAAVGNPYAVNAGMAWYRANIPRFDDIAPQRDAWPHMGASTRVPTLLIRGENDRTFVREMGELAAAHASDLKVETIPGVGHWTPFEKPDEATRLLADFVEIPKSCRAK